MTTPLHTIEPELRGRTPRTVRFTRSTQAARAWLLALLVGGVWLVWWLAARDLRDLAALRTGGQRATADVMGKHETHGRTTTYYLDYGFLGNWVWVNDNEQVSSSEYDRAEIGDTLPVTYLPAHPQTHRVGAVTAARLRRQRLKWAMGELATFAILGALFFVMERRYRNHRHLLRIGVPVVGVVLERKAVRGKSTTYFVWYRFPPAGPGDIQLKKIPVTRRFYDECEPGAMLTILYDYGHPANNYPYWALTDVTLPDR